MTSSDNTTFTKTTFEGGPNNTVISQPIAGATFGGWLTIVDSDQGGSGNFAAEPSPSTTAYWRSTSEFPDHVREIALATPVSGVSLFYADGYQGVRIEGLDANGNIIAYRSGSFNWRAGSGGDPTGTYDAWWPLQIDVGKNVLTKLRMYGQENYTGIDDFTTCVSSAESPRTNYELGGCISAVDDRPPTVSFPSGSFGFLAVTPNPRGIGVSSDLTATVIDHSPRSGPNLPYGSEIASAEFNVDGGAFQPMQVGDHPSLNWHYAARVASVIPGSSELGIHETCVRATDVWRNTGSPVCTTFRVSDLNDRMGPITSVDRVECSVERPYPYSGGFAHCFSNNRASVSVDMIVTVYAQIDDGSTGNWDIASAEYSIDGAPFQRITSGVITGGALDEIMEQVYVRFRANPWFGEGRLPDAGMHEVCLRGTDRLGNVGETACFALAVYGSELEAILDELQAIANADPKSPLAKILNDALDQLETAIADLADTPPDPQSALGNLKGAAGDLEAAIREGLLDHALGHALLNALAAVAWEHASNEILAAQRRPGASRTEIRKAILLAAEGHTLAQAQSFKDAIDKYKEALTTARTA